MINNFLFLLNTWKKPLGESEETDEAIVILKSIQNINERGGMAIAPLTSVTLSYNSKGDLITEIINTESPFIIENENVDLDTDIIIRGNLTGLDISDIICTEINIQNQHKMESLTIEQENTRTSIDLKCNIKNCENLVSFDFNLKYGEGNVILNTTNCGEKLYTISYRTAEIEKITNSIIELMRISESTEEKVLYTDTTAPYYSLLESAAEQYGWVVR